MNIYRIIYSILAGFFLGWIVKPIMPDASSLAVFTFILLGAFLLQALYVWKLEQFEPKNRKNGREEESSY